MEGAWVLDGFSVPLEGQGSMDSASALPHLLVHLVAHRASFRVCVLSLWYRQSHVQGRGGTAGSACTLYPHVASPPCLVSLSPGF